MLAEVGGSPLKPIRCTRVGCSDVLHNADALKYHLHFHNIGDALDDTGVSSLGGSPRNITYSDAAVKQSSLYTLSDKVDYSTSVIGHHAGLNSVQRSVAPASRNFSTGNKRGSSRRSSPHSKAGETLPAHLSSASIVSLEAISLGPRGRKSPPLRSRGRHRSRSTAMSVDTALHPPACNPPFPSSPTPLPSLTTCARAILSPQMTLSASRIHDSGVFMQMDHTVLDSSSEYQKLKSPKRARSPFRGEYLSSFRLPFLLSLFRWFETYIVDRLQGRFDQ